MNPVPQQRSASTSVSDVGSELLRVEGLKVHFPVLSPVLRRRKGSVRAVDGIDLTIGAGETFGLVGESGCGKSTTGRALLRLVEPTEGRITFDSQDITRIHRRQLQPLRAKMQIVLQDPFSSMDPRMSIATIIAEPLRIHGLYKDRVGGRRRVDELLELVGLDSQLGGRFPHELSGGQRQRVCIARALANNPRLLILDEAVSALDVSIQAQVITLLEDLQKELGLAYLFISHDLSVVKHISDRVAVMYLGRIVEVGTRDEIFRRPTHPYTQALLSGVPIPDPTRQGEGNRIVLKGEVPSPQDPPSGCRFRTRCWKAQPKCAESDPPLIVPEGQHHRSACFFPELLEVRRL